jgi:opacity protein-like surface antigen
MGKKMHKVKMIRLAVLIAALILIPTMGWAQDQIPTRPLPAAEPSFFLGGYLGFGGSSSTQTFNGLGLNGQFSGEFNAFFQGGVKLGYWFTPQGTYAASWYPEWMKYFGFYTDVSYHALNHPNNILYAAGFPLMTGNSSGYVWTWAFMFAARYGFMQDNEVPFGRLQPYVAVGPAIFFSGQDYNFAGLTSGYNNSTDVGLAVEGGLRYFLARNVSMEATFKYRYFEPKYNFSPLGANIQPQTNLFSGQFGLAYHF